MGPPSRRRRRRRRRCVGWIGGRVRPRAATCQCLVSFRARHSVRSSSIYARAERALSRMCRMGRAGRRARVRALLLCIGENLIYFSTFRKDRKKKIQEHQGFRLESAARHYIRSAPARVGCPRACRSEFSKRGYHSHTIGDTASVVPYFILWGTGEVRRCTHPLG